MLNSLKWFYSLICYSPSLMYFSVIVCVYTGTVLVLQIEMLESPVLHWLGTLTPNVSCSGEFPKITRKNHKVWKEVEKKSKFKKQKMYMKF